MPGLGGYVRKVSKSVPGVSSSSLQTAVSGSYQTEQMSGNAIQLVAATEYEIGSVATNILANTASKDELFSWVKTCIYFYDTGTPFIGEWFMLRLLIADADPDLDSEDIVEALQKDKRILRRGWYAHGHETYAGYAKLEEEYFNVKLRYGEELRLLLLPYRVGAAATFNYKGRLEWRQQGK